MGRKGMQSRARVEMCGVGEKEGELSLIHISEPTRPY